MTSSKSQFGQQGISGHNNNSASDDNIRHSSDISPIHHTIPLDNTLQLTHRHPTESPVQFANLNLPVSAPSSSSNIDPSPSIEVPPAEDSGHNGSGSNHSQQLPPNAYANTPSNLLNFDTSSSSNQLQPFNLFGDLNFGAGNSSSGGLNDFTGFGMTNSNSANLEYAVLSSMLQNSGYGNTSPMGFTDTLSSGGTNIPSSSSNHAMYQGIFTGSEDYGQMSFGFPPAAFENSNNTSNNHNGTGGMNSLIMTSQANNSPSGINTYLPSAGSNNSNSSQNAMPSLQAPTNSFGALPIDHNWPTIASKMPTGNEATGQQQQHQHQAHQQPQHSGAQQSPSYTQIVQPALQVKPKPVVSSTGVMKVEDVYKRINKPYVSQTVHCSEL